MESRSLPVPDGLDGVRVDAALAKMLGFSRTFAAEVAEADGVRQDGRVLGKSDRLRGGAWLEVEWQARREPRGRSRSRCPISASSTTMTTSSWSTSRPASPPTRPSGGKGRRCSARSPAADSASPRPAQPSGRASCIASMSARAGSWSSPRPSTPTRRSSARSRSARSRRSITPSCRGTPIRSPGRSTRRSGGIPTHSWKFAVTPDGQGLRHALRDARGVPRRLAARDPSRDRADAPDPRAHGRAPASVRRRSALRRRPDAVGAARPDAAVAARAPALVRPSRDRATG